MNPILLLTLEYSPQIGGIATYLSRMVECFPEGEIQVLAQKPSKEEEVVTHQADMESVAPIYRRPLTVDWLRPRSLPSHYYLSWLSRKEGLPGAIVISHVLPLGRIALRMKRRKGVPYVVILHGMDAALALEAGGRKRRQATGVIENADLVVANSRYTASLAHSLGAQPDRTMIVHPSPGFSWNYQVPEGAAEALKDRLGLEGKYVVMTAGRLVERKGFDDIMRAVAQLSKSGSADKIHQLVVGDGPDRQRLESLGSDLGISDRVTFAGTLPADELAAAYGLADVFCMAPRALGADVEGFGIVYLEANLFGTPVIGTRSGGVTDAIVDGKTGILVEPARPDMLAEALGRLINDRDLAKRMGRDGQKRVIEGFHWTDQCRPLVGAIWHLADKGKL